MENTTMKAAVLQKQNTIELQTIPFPKIGPDAGLLKVETVGVCGTDVSYFQKSNEAKVLGHHVVGQIEAIGETASKKWGLTIGDRVVMEEYIPCGQCSFCRTGEYRYCQDTDPSSGGIRYGATALTTEPGAYGGFSQYMYLHPNAVIHKLSKRVPGMEASFALPLANGFEWMCLQGSAGPGTTVLIQGPGQQGLASAIAAKHAGAEVIVTGLNNDINRLMLAKELGVDYVINVETEDLVERVRHITSNKLVDLVLDVTTGGEKVISKSLQAAGHGATIILGAYKGAELSSFDIDTVIQKTLTIKGVRGHSYQSVKMAIDCITSRLFPLGKLHSHDYPLEKTEDALKTANGEGEPNPLLVTVSPWS